MALAALPLFGQRLPARQSLDEWISIAGEQIVTAADAMPADRYSFAPSNRRIRGCAHVRDKAAIMAYLRGSFAALHESVGSLDDAGAPTVVTGQKHTSAWFAIDDVAHSFNHYGQMVEYLRMNGIIPPASR